MIHKNSTILFSGTSHLHFAEKIAEFLGVELGEVTIKPFPDGEIGVRIVSDVRGRDVFVVQSIARDPNLYLMELLIFVDAAKRASARSIVAVIPYFGYARQDRKDKSGMPITARLVADLLEKAGVTRVLTMDLHEEQIQGFFNIPVDHLSARELFQEEIKRLNLDAYVIVAPDMGSALFAKAFAKDLNVDLAIINKRRLSAEDVRGVTLTGDVKGKDVVLVDDICSTGATLKAASKICKDQGARRVIACVTHALSADLEGSAIEQFFITDTISFSKGSKDVRVVSVHRLFADAMQTMMG